MSLWNDENAAQVTRLSSAVKCFSPHSNDSGTQSKCLLASCELLLVPRPLSFPPPLLPLAAVDAPYSPSHYHHYYLY
jgi:hypothetical protein